MSMVCMVSKFYDFTPYTINHNLLYLNTFLLQIIGAYFLSKRQKIAGSSPKLRSSDKVLRPHENDLFPSRVRKTDGIGLSDEF